MAPKSTGTLIYQWTAANKEEWRLIAVGNLTAGYEDMYLIEQRELDGLGGMRWVSSMQWTANSEAATATILVGALKVALRTQTLASSKPAPKPGAGLLQLISRVTQHAPGAIAAALSPCEWRELRDALTDHFKPAA